MKNQNDIITRELDHMPDKFRWQAYRLPLKEDSPIGWGVDEAGARQDLFDVEAGKDVGARPAKVPRL